MRLLRVPVAVLLTYSLPSVALAQYPLAQHSFNAGPADSELSEDEKMEKAKGLYIEAERLAGEENWEAAVVLYEQAYYLVPGKHGFAHKVGIAAWKVNNCDKAFEYLTHFLQYADREKQGDKISEAEGILAEIEAKQCRTQTEPEPEPEPEPTKPVETENPFETEAQPGDDGKPDKGKKKGGKGMLVGGAVLITLGVGGVVVGAVGASMASSAGNSLDDLSSTSTLTGYPVGDYACRDVTGDMCPTDLEGKLGTGKALTFAGFIGGGVLVVVGATLIGLHVAKNKKKAGAAAQAKPAVQLTGLGPALLPGGAGATASLRF